MAKLIATNGTVKEVKPANGKSFFLHEMQALVGGLIEPVYLEDGKIMVVNEEGLLIGLDLNAKASAMTGITIVGPAIVCNDEEFQ